MRDHTRRQLYRYVLLILILKDVFLLGTIGCNVLLAELLAVGIIIPYSSLFIKKASALSTNSKNPH